MKRIMLLIWIILLLNNPLYMMATPEPIASVLVLDKTIAPPVEKEKKQKLPKKQQFKKNNNHYKKPLSKKKKLTIVAAVFLVLVPIATVAGVLLFLGRGSGFLAGLEGIILLIIALACLVLGLVFLVWAITNKTEISEDVKKERVAKILEEEEKLAISDQSKTLKNASPRTNTIYAYYQNIIVKGKEEVSSYKNDKDFKNEKGKLYKKTVDTARKILICNKKIQMLEEADNFSNQLSAKKREEYMNLQLKLIDLEVKKMQEFWIREALSPKDQEEIDSEIKEVQRRMDLIIKD